MKASPLTLAKALLKRLIYFSLAMFYRGTGLVLSPKSRRAFKGPLLVTGIPGFGGGPFTFLRFLLTEISDGDTVVCSFKLSEIRPELTSLCGQLGIQLIVRPDGGPWKDLWSLSRIVRRLRPRTTIINVGTFSQCFHLLPLSSPILYYSHSIWHHPLPAFEAIFLKYFRIFPNHRVFTVSAAAKDSLDQVYFHGVKPSPVVWLHNGLTDRGRDADVPESLPTTVLTLGSVAWYKNPHLWERVARRVVAGAPAGTVRFIWAGQGDFFAELAQRNDEFVQFIGFDPEPDRLIQQAAVYFQPSQFESFGLGVCEAMMFSKPIVASAVGALPELIEQGVEGYLVELEQEDTMVVQLLVLINDQTVRQSMGKAARTRFLRQFTAERWRSHFLALMETYFGDH